MICIYAHLNRPVNRRSKVKTIDDIVEKGKNY